MRQWICGSRRRSLPGALVLASLIAVLGLAAPGCSGDDAAGETGDLVAGDGAGDSALDAVDGDVVADVPGDATEVEDEEVAGTVDGIGDLPDEEFVYELRPIRFTSPVNASADRGTILVAVETQDGSEWLVDELVVALNGEPIFRDTKLPTSFILDTRDHPNGPAFLEAAARIQEEYETAVVDFEVKNPAFRFIRVFSNAPSYGNSTTVELDVDLGLPGVIVTADFSALDASFDPAGVVIKDRINGTYSISYTVSATNTRLDGEYGVALTASKDGVTLAYDGTRVRLQNRADGLLRTQGALHVDRSPPEVSSVIAEAPAVLSIEGSDVIIAGGTATVTVNANDPQGNHEVVGLLIEVEGRDGDVIVPYLGYDQVPLEFFSGSVELTLLFSTIGREESEYDDLDELVLQVSAIDAKGLRSPPVEHILTINHQAQSGDVQVSLSWDTSSDVDLHVREPKDDGSPDGEEIYYGHKYSATGGELDLDSNPACSIDGINNENVTWELGESPEGTYQVYVDYFDDCGVTGQDSTHFIVAVKNCGVVDTWDGTFSPQDADSGGAGSGVFVAEFDSSCGGFVYGNIRFEDQTFDETGFRARTWSPVRYARVEVRRQVDNAILATGYADRNGRYAIRFGNDGLPGVYVRVFTETNREDGLRNVAVRNHPKFGIIYSYAAPAFTEDPKAPKHLNIDIPEMQNELTVAGAFNIFDVIVSGHDLIRRMTGKDLDVLDTYWQTGADVTETKYCSKKRYDEGLCAHLGTLSIQGRDDDRDEYDDCVILQELFRFAHDQVSISDDPGGFADGSRIDPLTAWGNGVSMFFAAHTLKIPFFLNKNRFGVYRLFELEPMDSSFAYGTSNASMDGRLSEYLVAAALWDLADGGSLPSPDGDGVDDQGLGIYDSVFNYLSKPVLGGDARGVVGRDFVDFLDGWFCRGYGHDQAVSDILDERRFPYDKAGPSSCL